MPLAAIASKRLEDIRHLDGEMAGAGHASCLPISLLLHTRPQAPPMPPNSPRLMSLLGFITTQSAPARPPDPARPLRASDSLLIRVMRASHHLTAH
jgi:hypothetical protein